MVHPEEVLHCLEEQTHDNRRIFEAMYAKGKESQQNENFNYTSLQGNKGTCSRNPFENNEGNNTPPKTPRAATGTCPSHHDSDEDVTSEDVIEFQQYSFYQKWMLKALEENGDQYFRYMAKRGWKLRKDFDVERIIPKREPTKVKILREEIHELRK